MRKNIEYTMKCPIFPLYVKRLKEKYLTIFKSIMHFPVLLNKNLIVSYIHKSSERATNKYGGILDSFLPKSYKNLYVKLLYKITFTQILFKIAALYVNIP